MSLCKVWGLESGRFLHRADYTHLPTQTPKNTLAIAGYKFNCCSIDVQDILSHQLEDEIKQKYQSQIAKERI